METLMTSRNAPAQTVSAVSGIGVTTRQSAAVLAIAFGLLIAVGIGFVQAHALHEGTHDTRHAFGLPCH